MAKIFAITNQKGGVGKTTTAINLCASLAQLKQKVLLIDCDPQGNASTGSGLNKFQIEFGLDKLLLQHIDISNAIIQTPHAYDLIPSNADLTAAEVHLVQTPDQAHILHNILKTIASNYDYIILDCPPALNALTLNALVAANHLLIPMQCEYFALEGLAALISTMQQVQAHLNPNLQLLGILRTLYDPRNRLANAVSKQLFEHFPQRVFEIFIPKNTKLAEAPSHGLPSLHYAKHSSGAKAYFVLAQILIAREETKI